MLRRILRRTLRSCAGAFGPCAAQGPAPLGGGGAENRKGQNLGLNMRLLLAKDRLSTLDHQGSDQPAVRPKMVNRKLNHLKTKLNGYPAPCGTS
eukprot:scaffold25620_cov99-Isochrysis_galbana.AAC.5